MAFDPKKPVQTRCGLPVRILATDRKGPLYDLYPLVGLVSDRGDETMESWTVTGAYRDGVVNHDMDLVNVAQTHEVDVYFHQRIAPAQRPPVSWVARNPDYVYLHPGDVFPSRLARVDGSVQIGRQVCKVTTDAPKECTCGGQR